eukprot:scaffold846_cov252-Pinguiococcus_pyrenoidosus.AAC.34
MEPTSRRQNSASVDKDKAILRRSQQGSAAPPHMCMPRCWNSRTSRPVCHLLDLGHIPIYVVVAVHFVRLAFLKARHRDGRLQDDWLLALRHVRLRDAVHRDVDWQVAFHAQALDGDRKAVVRLEARVHFVLLPDPDRVRTVSIHRHRVHEAVKAAEVAEVLLSVRRIPARVHKHIVRENPRVGELVVAVDAKGCLDVVHWCASPEKTRRKVKHPIHLGSWRSQDDFSIRPRTFAHDKYHHWVPQRELLLQKLEQIRRLRNRRVVPVKRLVFDVQLVQRPEDISVQDLVAVLLVTMSSAWLRSLPHRILAEVRAEGHGARLHAQRTAVSTVRNPLLSGRHRSHARESPRWWLTNAGIHAKRIICRRIIRQRGQTCQSHEYTADSESRRRHPNHSRFSDARSLRLKGRGKRKSTRCASRTTVPAPWKEALADYAARVTMSERC